MVAEDQNILHNYETLSGLTYSKLANSKIDDDQVQCLPCNGGYSCEVGSDPSQCPGGKYSPTGEYECFTCPAGHYCPAKSEYPTPCSVNTANPNAGQNSNGACNACEAGLYAPTGSSV